MAHELVHTPPPTTAEAVPRSGPAAAVVLAAGVAAFTLGLLSVLTAASGRASELLTLSDRVGDVSGLTTVAAGAFFATWAALGVAWRRSDPPLGRIAVLAGALVALGLVGTFPPFFDAVGGGGG